MVANPAAQLEVIIVGGGAVGLFLGCRLAQLGFRLRVLERRTEAGTHSRAIGVHPPALERLAVLGLAERFIGEGMTIRRGHAFSGTRRLGALEFSACPPPYPFILSLPQFRTETLLRERLCDLAPDALLRGAEVVAVHTDAHGARVDLRNGDTLCAHTLVAADGKHSLVRQQLGIPFPGGAYPDHYLMGDVLMDGVAGSGVTGNTVSGSDAGLYFTRAGLVESFPLPGSGGADKRRWVVKTPARVHEPTAELLAALVRERLGLELPPTTTMLSAFGVERFLAREFVRGRVALLGDAAHVLSPIGGQGMNLGWLGAWRLAEALAGDDLGAYTAHRRSAVRAIRRAEFNTVMGRATPFAPVRDAAVWSILHSPLRRTFARIFTMRGL